MLTKLCVEASLFLDSLKKDQRGVTAIEYAIVAVGVAAVVATAFADDGSLRLALDKAFTTVTDKIKGITGSE